MNNSKKNKREFYDKLTIKELEDIAKKGNVEAQFNFGECYVMGLGVEADLKKVVDWYTKAAKQGFLWNNQKGDSMIIFAA